MSGNLLKAIYIYIYIHIYAKSLYKIGHNISLSLSPPLSLSLYIYIYIYIYGGHRGILVIMPGNENSDRGSLGTKKISMGTIVRETELKIQTR